MNNMDERLQEIEQWKAAAEERLRTLFRISGETNEALRDATKGIKELTVSMSLLNTQLAVIVTQNAGRKDCPNPGMCKDLEPRIAELEKKEVAFSGSWRGIVFVFGCGAAVVSTVAAIIGIIKLFVNHKP